jgi:ATP-binding cassette, subfamily B, bacterial MsbA
MTEDKAAVADRNHPGWAETSDDDESVYVVKRVFREFIWPRRLLVFRSLLTMIFVASTTGALPFLMQMAADRIFIQKDVTTLYILPLVVAVVMAVRSLAEYSSRMTEARISGEIVAELREKLFKRLANSDLGFLQGTHSARFVSVFSADTLVVNQAASQTLTALVRNALQSAALIGAMLWLDWVLGALVLVSLPISMVLMSKQRRKLTKSVKQSLSGSGDIARIVAQTLAGIRVVKAYGQEEAETARAVKHIEATRSASLRTQKTRARTGPFTEGLSGLGFAAAIFYGGWRGIHGGLTLGEFMGFMAAAMLIYQPLKTLANLQNILMEGVIAARRVFAILDEAPKVVELTDAAVLPTARGAIEFDHVTFGYNEEAPVLHDLCLKIAPGQKVAFVGPSGAGKSTLINLVLRFYDPDDGVVRIDGLDISDFTLASVRRASALLTQDPVLFDDTIRANIAYGSPDADQTAIETASRAADAHGFICALDHGYDTQVGEAGGLLSGGQKQRIAIARAMLRSAPILLLDEPTSALDANSEAHVQAALDGLFAGRTVLMIAHRLSTVKRADMIVVLDKGRIVETGTHDELAVAGGLYAHLHKTQLSGGGTGAENDDAA